MRVQRPWTAEDDRVLQEGLAAGRSLAEIAVQLRRSDTAVRHHRRRLGKEPLHRAWSQERGDELIRLMEEHRSWDEIGRIMGNAVKYLQARAVESGVTLRTSNGYTMAEVGRMMGVDSKAVGWWIDQGWLRDHRTKQRQGRGFLRMVEHDDLVAFLEREDTWPAWDPERITDPALREWTSELRRGIRFYTTTQAAPFLFITPLGLQKAIREGRVRAIKVGPNWYLRSDWIRPMGEARRTGGPRRRMSHEEAAVVVELWGSVPVTHIAEKIGFDRSASVHRAAQRLGLPPIGRGHWQTKRAEERRAVG